MNQAYKVKAPVYLRMGKSDRCDVHTTQLHAQAGSLLQTKFGQASDVAFIATGSMVSTAMDIAAVAYPDASVWSAPFIKPINSKQVATICAKFKRIVVLEEHSVLGGLGSVICEIASEFAPARILRIGVQDRFSLHCGSYEYLLKENELDGESIKRRIYNFCI